MKQPNDTKKDYLLIDVSVAFKEIEFGSIVVCELDSKEYYFNNGEENCNITSEMIFRGKWKVYTWSD